MIGQNTGKYDVSHNWTVIFLAFFRAETQNSFDHYIHESVPHLVKQFKLKNLEYLVSNPNTNQVRLSYTA